MGMIPDSEYKQRLKRIQAEMEVRNLDLIVGYSSENEPHHARYLADFAPNFDFAGFLIPQRGEAALLTGGPESIVYAKSISKIRKILIHPFLLETSAPPYPETAHLRFSHLIPQVTDVKKVRRVGLAGANIFPYNLYSDLTNTLKACEFIEADDVLFKARMIKSKNEIALMQKASQITEKAIEAAINAVEAGRTEQEVEAHAKSTLFLNGAEGLAYPIWVCSGERTNQGLSRSTDKKLKKSELIQLSIGCKYYGYCGNMCRPLTIGKPPKDALKLMETGLEVENRILEAMRPGIPAAEVYNLFKEILTRHGFGKEATLYGPAHGTGLQECEGPWVDASSTYNIQPNMIFNVDIWLSKGKIGLRWEDGVAITESGGKELSSYRREIIGK